MKRIAHDIIIENEIKVDFVLDEKGEATQETYEFKEYKVVDVDNNVLEVGRYTDETITKEQICRNTGIRLGLSAYITFD